MKRTGKKSRGVERWRREREKNVTISDNNLF